MKRLTTMFRRLAGFSLVPLSLVPFAFALPVVSDSHATYRRLHQSGPAVAPRVALSAAELARFAPLGAVSGEVPVITYHGINRHPDGYSVTPEAFARQLKLLRHAGFETISIGEYARFRRGDTAGLPARPLLITFDDGRLDSYRGADAALAREHMRAAMYVIGGRVQAGDLSYLTWKELHAMARSGRWDVQPHAFDGHVSVATDAQGDQAPFYAARRFLRSTGRESFADYEQRVSEDIFRTRQMMHDQGIAAPTFAVPYGDYGQHGTNDPRIPGFLSSLLQRQFGTFFVQADGNDPGYTQPGTGAAERYEVHTSTTLAALYGWLKRHHPDTLRAQQAAARRDAEQRRAARAARVAQHNRDHRRTSHRRHKKGN